MLNISYDVLHQKKMKEKGCGDLPTMIDSEEVFIQMNDSFQRKQDWSNTMMKLLDQTLHTTELHGRVQRGFLVLSNAISHGRGLTSL